MADSHFLFKACPPGDSFEVGTYQHRLILFFYNGITVDLSVFN